MNISKSLVFLVVMAILFAAVSCADDGTDNSGAGGDAGADGDADGDVDGDSDADADGDAQVSNACAEDARVGSFRINLTETYTTVSGSVSDGVTPGNVPVELATEGSCVLQGPSDLGCNPPCTSVDETCGFDGTCIPAPLQYDAGAVTVTGMNAEVSMEANAFNFSYSATVRDPNPAYDAGAALTLNAAGGDYSPFSLSATGVASLDTGLTAVTVDRDAPAEISWIPGSGADGDQYVHIRLVVNAHGATSGWIICEVPDTGAYTVPAALVTQLIDLGLSGWPLVEIARRSDASTTIEPGCVELIVFSQVSLPVEIPGFVSCSTPEDCPDGQDCLEDLTCG